jgi:outer membrane protein TolC
MRQICRVGILLSLLLALTPGIKAEVYTLDKCIEIALQHNASVVAARNDYESSKWGVANSYGLLIPSISISSSQSQSWSPYGKAQGASGGFTISESFIGLGVFNYTQITGKRAQKNSSYYNYVAARQDLVLSVKEAYYNLIKTGMLVDVASDAVKSGDEQLKVAQSRYDLGSAALSDVLKSKVLRSNAQLDLITAENNNSVAKASLNFVMGIDISQDFEVTKDLPKTSFDMTYDQALSEALSNNSSYRKATYDLASAKSGLLAASTAFLPDLSFNVNYGASGDKYFDLYSPESSKASRNIGFSISYNILNHLSDITSLVSQKKFVNTQKKNLENTLNGVALAVRQAFLDIQMNKQKLDLNDESVAAAQEDLNIVREKYNLGAATILEVLDAEVSFKTAQTNQVQALFDYNLAISNLEKAMGR